MTIDFLPKTQYIIIKSNNYYPSFPIRNIKYCTVHILENIQIIQIIQIIVRSINLNIYTFYFL